MIIEKMKVFTKMSLNLFLIYMLASMVPKDIPNSE